MKIILHIDTVTPMNAYPRSRLFRSYEAQKEVKTYPRSRLFRAYEAQKSSYPRSRLFRAYEQNLVQEKQVLIQKQVQWGEDEGTFEFIPSNLSLSNL